MPIKRLLIVATMGIVGLVVGIVVSTRSSNDSVRSRAGSGTIPTLAPLPGVAAVASGSCDYPRQVAAPSWYPADLPLPGGSYTSRRLLDSNGYHRAEFVVPGTLPELARFILREWPNRRWTMGRGDAEQDEMEDSFEKGSAVGAFKAQAEDCSPGFSNMLIVFSPRGSTGSGPSTQPGSPLAPGSPSP